MLGCNGALRRVWLLRWEFDPFVQVSALFLWIGTSDA